LKALPPRNNITTPIIRPNKPIRKPKAIRYSNPAKTSEKYDSRFITDIAQKELEDAGDGYKIKKATCLSEKEFFETLENKAFTRRWVEF